MPQSLVFFSGLRLGGGVSTTLVTSPVAYEVRFADDVKGHLNALTIPERSAALDVIERQLPYEPLVETRNRKPLRPNPIAPCELRVGKLRVFYEVGAGRAWFGEDTRRRQEGTKHP